ncbi:MAG: hypothetical protein IJ097_00860 [Bacilli bacterium]|nr:hypothetical protein [Bacilli bacterium]
MNMFKNYKINRWKRKKSKNFIIRNLTLMILGILGAVIGSTTVGYATLYDYDSINVGYDNTNSSLSSTDVQSAIDELCDDVDITNNAAALETAYTPKGQLRSIEPAAVSVPSGTATQLASVTLPAGKWMINGAARYNSNATGYREIWISRNSDCDGILGNSWFVIENAVNGTYTYLSFNAPYVSTASSTYYLCGYQTSPNALSTLGRLYAINVK